MSNEVELQLDEPSFDGFEDADLGDIFGVPNPKPAVSAIPPTLLNNDDNASTFNFLPDDNMSENMRTQRLKEQNGFESSLNSNIDGQQLAPLAKCKQEQIYNDNEFENGYNNNGNNNNNINNNQNINNNNNGIQASTDGTTNIAMHQAGYYDVPPDLHIFAAVLKTKSINNDRNVTICDYCDMEPKHELDCWCCQQAAWFE